MLAMLALTGGLLLVIVACGGEEEETPAPAPAAATVDVTALADQMASRLEQSMLNAMAQMQPPLSEDQIRSLIEAAVSENAPEGISGAQIQAMVDSAVTAAAAEGVNQEDVTRAIGAALAEAAAAQAEPLSESDVARIVRSAVATPVPTPAPTPAPTAVPTATPAATMAPVPVASRISVAMPPMVIQDTLPRKAGFGGVIHLRPAFDFLIGNHRVTYEFEPQLAKEYSISPDGTTWSFQLQDGVMFNDAPGWEGVEFNADDVVHTWREVTKEDAALTGAVFWKRWLPDDSYFDIKGPYEIDMNISKPEPILDFWASELTFVMQSEDYWNAVGDEGYSAHPVGTGAFRFVEHEINSHFLYEKVDDHWRKTAEMDELEFKLIREPATREAVMLTKEVQMSIISNTVEGVQRIRDRGFSVVRSTQPSNMVEFHWGGQFYQLPEGATEKFGVTLNEDNPLLNVNVRKALNIAINREEMNDVFYGGEMAFMPVTHIFPPTDYGFKDSFVPYPYDPEEAKRLLTEAGYPDGFKMEVKFGASSVIPEIGDITESAVNYWQAVGIQIDSVDQTDSLWGQMKEYGLDVGAAMITFGRVSHELQMVLNLKIPEHIDQNFTSHTFDHPDLGRMIREFEVTIDKVERIRQMEALGDYLYGNYATVPLFWYFQTYGYDPEVIEEYLGLRSATVKWEYATLR
jgi:peptide/nickel transport system substrate-binding protein